MSATDEIYRELWDGLEKGLDWSESLARHSNSKGPLYNAIGRFFTEVGSRIAVLKEEASQYQGKVDQARIALDSLDQQKKEAQGNVVSLEKRRNVLNEQVKATETKLAQKSGLLKQVTDLEKMGFNVELLNQLKESLMGIGAKRGLKGKEAAGIIRADVNVLALEVCKDIH
jgi:vacuolar-type H+-ATPase subunit I/STV1